MNHKQTRNAKPGEYAILIVFFVLLFALTVGGILLPDRKFSDNENRNLQQLPALKWDEFFDGTWMSDISSYLSDQAPMRDQMIMLHAAMERMLGKGECGGVLAGKEGYLFEREDYPSAERLERSLKAIDAFAAYAKEQGVPLTLALAGRKIDVELDYLPNGYGTDTQTWLWKEIEDAAGELEHADFLNLRQVLLDAPEKDLYYRTDHHWNAAGAALGYEAICKEMGLTCREKGFFTYEQASTEFYGTTWSNSGMFWVGPDEMSLPHFEGENRITTDTGMKTISGFYVTEMLEKKDKYAVFFGGQLGYMELRGEENAERGKLLIIKDSFAHAVLPMLAADYDMDVLDLRYYTWTKGTPAQILEKGDYDAVLVLCSTPLLTDPSGRDNGRLDMEELLTGLPARA